MCVCFHCSDSFLSLSSALTVLKQEIPSPFGTDQVKKLVKTSPLNKEQVDEISQIDQASSSAAIKNGTTTSANNRSTSVGTVATNTNVMTCHLNGNSNSSASNELVNCLDNVAQQQPNSNDQNDERNDSNNLSMNDKDTIHKNEEPLLFLCFR